MWAVLPLVRRGAGAQALAMELLIATIVLIAVSVLSRFGTDSRDNSNWNRA